MEAALDAHGLLWLLCDARMGSPDYEKQHPTEALFVIAPDGRLLSSSELDLPLSLDQRNDTVNYHLAVLSNGRAAVVFASIEEVAPTGEKFLGAYYAEYATMGARATPLRRIAGATSEPDSLLALPSGNLLLGGLSDLVVFNPDGQTLWSKPFPGTGPWSFDEANLTDGLTCVAASDHSPAGGKVLVQQLDPSGSVKRSASFAAYWGRVAAGPDSSCAAVFERKPSRLRSEYFLTAFDSNLNRQWTVTLPLAHLVGREIQVIPIPGGWLARVQHLLFAYSTSGRLLWTGSSPDSALLAPAADGYFLIAQGTTNSFEVKRVRIEPKCSPSSTPHAVEPSTPYQAARAISVWMKSLPLNSNGSPVTTAAP